jgi:pantothenate kinase
MGAGFHGGINNSFGAMAINLPIRNNKQNVSTTGSIKNNAIETAKYFDYKNGLFGEKNRKNGRIPREIFSKNPSTAATLFFNTLSQGGQKHVFNTSNGKGIEATLKDGSKITYRPLTSSIGSPAVEITISMSPDVKPKKYHFVQKGGNKK